MQLEDSETFSTEVYVKDVRRIVENRSAAKPIFTGRVRRNAMVSKERFRGWRWGRAPMALLATRGDSRSMRTQVFSAGPVGTPHLEFQVEGEAQPRRVALTRFPFTIGRQDGLDLTLPSGRVSRQHATIEFRQGRYWVRDLGSTNGTLLNGQRVEEAELADGDQLELADMTLVFSRGVEETPRPEATLVMAERAVANSGITPWILEHRRLQEMVLQQTLRWRFERIEDLERGACFGYELQWDEQEWLGDVAARRRLRGIDSRINDRLCELHRLVAVSRPLPAENPTTWFFNASTPEVGTPRFVQSLVRTRARLPEGHGMVAGIPHAAVCDIPYFRRFLQALTDEGIQIAYSDFRGGPAQIADCADLRPDFLKLSGSLSQGVGRSSGGQRQLQLIIRAAQEIGTEVIATHVLDQNDADTVYELGCRFAQGPAFGSLTGRKEFDWNGAKCEV